MAEKLVKIRIKKNVFPEKVDVKRAIADGGVVDINGKMWVGNDPPGGLRVPVSVAKKWIANNAAEAFDPFNEGEDPPEEE